MVNGFECLMKELKKNNRQHENNLKLSKILEFTILKP